MMSIAGEAKPPRTDFFVHREATFMLLCSLLAEMVKSDTAIAAAFWTNTRYTTVDSRRFTLCPSHSSQIKERKNGVHFLR